VNIDQKWFADTAGYETENCVSSLEFIDGRGLVEVLGFENGVLKLRRDDRIDQIPIRSTSPTLTSSLRRS
jgi:hypothetical protein